jgi:hypothetical protein
VKILEKNISINMRRTASTMKKSQKLKKYMSVSISSQLGLNTYCLGLASFFFWSFIRHFPSWTTEREIEGLREQLSVIHEWGDDEDASQDVGEMLPPSFQAK